MGGCLSSNRPRQAGDEGGAQPLPLGVQLAQLHPVVQSGAGDLAVACSTAAYSAAADAAVPCLLVKQTPGAVFVAMFEGLGEDKRAVAAFCRARVWELFQESSARQPDSPLEALRDTLHRLDAAIFASDKLKHAAKAGSGASAVLLLMDLRSQRCYCANVGAAACLLSRISGSFNAKAPEGFFLTQEHTTRNREELVRLQRRAPGEATPPGAATAAADEGPADATRALGFMDAKRQAGGSGALVCEAHATDHRLTATDQHLVLGSAAFWRLVAPADCALRAHFHEKFASRELERAAAAAAAAAAAGLQDAPSPSLQQSANTAEHLLYWALEKAARVLGKLQRERQGGELVGGAGRRLPPSVADLMALPLVPPPLAPAAGAASGPAAGGSGGQEEEQQQQQGEEQARQLLRSDVHGDIGLVVVTLRRQGHSMDGGMREALVAARARAAAAAAAAAAAQAAGGQPGAGAAAAAGVGEGYVERLTRRRWDQIRMLVEFHKAHRRVLLRQWWAAQDELYRRSRTAGARAGRINLFASPGSPSKLPSLAAAAAAARHAGAGSNATPWRAAEDRGVAGNRSVGSLAEAAAAAAKGGPRPTAKPSSLRGSPAKASAVGSRISSGLAGSPAGIKALRPERR